MYALLFLCCVNAPAHSAGGEEIYKAKCSFCHDSGAGQAPRISARADWSAREARGRNAMIESANRVAEALKKALAPDARIEHYAGEATVRGINIRVAAREGVVTLSGAVEKSDLIPRADVIARSIAGVRRVESKLVAAGMFDFD